MEEFVQMVVYKSGFIRLLNVKNLSQKARFNLPGLEPDEEVTCGSLSPQNQYNFALGTSHGNIYLGHYVGEGVVEEGWTKEGKPKSKAAEFQLKATRITGNADDGLLGAAGRRDHAVTSI